MVVENRHSTISSERLAPTMAEAAASRPDPRARILDEAERLFRHYGYTKTTVADIARELGMSPANVYRFFQSKAAIHEALVDRLVADVEIGALRIARLPLSAEQRLRLFVIE